MCGTRRDKEPDEDGKQVKSCSYASRGRLTAATIKSPLRHQNSRVSNVESRIGDVEERPEVLGNSRKPTRRHLWLDERTRQS